MLSDNKSKISNSYLTRIRIRLTAAPMRAPGKFTIGKIVEKIQISDWGDDNPYIVAELPKEKKKKRVHLISSYLHKFISKPIHVSLNKQSSDPGTQKVN